MPTRLIDDDDVNNVKRVMDTMALPLRGAVNERLCAIEGYEDLPRPLRYRLEEAALALWGAGYLAAVMTGREE